MRMRRKPNLEQRLLRAADLQIEDPRALKGRWLDEFKGFKALYLELGCGKGRFTCEMAKLHPDVLFVGIERVPDALLLALERAKLEELQNVRFIANDVRYLAELFAPDEVCRIYINFCDPWPGNRRVKRRLTSDDFLSLYKEVLPKGGELRFKTDNTELFEYSLKRFAACGFELRDVTRDLHGVETPLESPNDGEKAVMTNYEERFHSQGVKINRCEAISPGTPAESADEN